MPRKRRRSARSYPRPSSVRDRPAAPLTRYMPSHASSDKTFVTVGGGLAGAKAAETLREEGFDGRVVLVGAESVPPCERPPLSKEYLRGEAGREKVYVHDEGFYDEQRIELWRGRTATSLNAAARELTLDGGETLRYDGLLLTTGAEPRRLPIPGAELDGVMYLRT